MAAGFKTDPLRLVNALVHQVRNPLFVVSAMLDLLEEDLREKTGPQELVATARRELQRINRLFADLDEYARSSTQARMEVALAHIVVRAMGSVESQAREKEIDVVFRVKRGASAPVHVDASDLSRAIGRLLAHAIHRSPMGGVVRVTVGRNGSECVIEDQGTPPSAETCARIFEPFLVRPEGGAGLELANARRAVERHGGRLRAFPGAGLVFECRLPRASDSEPKRGQSRTLTGRRRKRNPHARRTRPPRSRPGSVRRSTPRHHSR